MISIVKHDHDPDPSFDPDKAAGMSVAFEDKRANRADLQCGDVLMFRTYTEHSTMPLLLTGRRYRDTDKWLMVPLRECKDRYCGPCDACVFGMDKSAVGHCGLSVWVPEEPLWECGAYVKRLDAVDIADVHAVLANLQAGLIPDTEEVISKFKADGYKDHMKATIEFMNTLVCATDAVYCAFHAVGTHVPMWACTRPNGAADFLGVTLPFE